MTGTQFPNWQRGGGGSLSAIAPLIITSGVISIPVADATHDGYLSSIDWNRFNTAAVGGVTAIGTINSQTPSANGLVILSDSLYAQYATASVPGMISIGSQIIGGQKSFNTQVIITTATNFLQLGSNNPTTYTSATTTASRTFTTPDADSNSVIPVSSAVSNQWITNITAGGIQVTSQPGFSNISGTAAVNQGGTGQITYLDGQLLIGNTATTGLSKATLTAGSGVTIVNGNGSITISASGGGGGVTAIGTINSQTPSADGLVILSSILYAQYATASVPGMISNGPQIIGGQKSFNTQVIITTATNFLQLGSSNPTTYTSATTTASRTFTTPDADSNSVIPVSSAVSNQWITNITAGGVQVTSQPGFSNISGTAAVNQGGTGQITYLDGQLLIGNTATTGLSKATLTAGSGVTIVNGNGSITISASGGGGAVSSVTGTANQISASPTTGSVIIALNNGISLGSYQTTTAPPGGIIMPGYLGVGVSTVVTGCAANFTGNFGNILLLAGVVQTIVDSNNNQSGLNVAPIFAPTTGSTISSAIYANSRLQIPISQTIAKLASVYATNQLTVNSGSITDLYGFYFDGGDSPTLVTRAYGAYFTTPLASTIVSTDKGALYTDNISIGNNTAFASNGNLIASGTGVFGGGSSAASALLTLNSTTQGLLVCRMTQTQRDAISSPAVGLVIYNTTDNDIEVWNGTAWAGAVTGGVTSIAGTANQIDVSASTGAVTLSLSSALVTPGTFTSSGIAGFGIGALNTYQVRIQSSGVSSLMTTAIHIDGALTPPADTIGILLGTALIPSTTNKSAYGMYVFPSILSNTGQTMGDGVGIYCALGLSTNIADINRLIGIYIGTGSPPSSGTILKAFGFYCSMPYVGMGNERICANFEDIVCIGTTNPTPLVCAILQLDSSSAGFLPPRMITGDKNAIPSPQVGLVVYDTIINDLQFYNGTVWVGTTASGVTSIAGTANQIDVSASTGAVTLSLSSALVTPGTFTSSGIAGFGIGALNTYQVRIQSSGVSSLMTTAIHIDGALTPPADTIGILLGTALIPSTTNKSAYGMYVFPSILSNTGQTMGDGIGIYCALELSTNIANINRLIGIYIGTGVPPSSGTILKAFGFYCSMPYVGMGNERICANFEDIVCIGTTNPTPLVCAILQLDSSSAGFLPPRMITGDKNAIPSPQGGLVVYDTIINDLQFYNGTNWISTSGVTSLATTSNQINTSGSTGALTLSLSSSLVLPGTFSTANTVTLTGLTASQAVVTDGSKNLVSLAYLATGGTSNLVSRDSNGNTRSNNTGSVATLVTSGGGTTTLTVASSKYQILQGTSAQTFVLPDATTLFIGARFELNNNSTGLMTVNNNGGSLINTVISGGSIIIICSSISTTNGTWDTHFQMPSNAVYGTSGLNITGTLQVGVVTPNSSALFQVDSTLLGALLPRMTTTQKNAVTPTEGLIIYDNVLHDLQFYNGTSWITTGGVFSIAGTSNQINASSSSGAVTLSISSTLALPGTIQLGGTLTGNSNNLTNLGSLDVTGFTGVNIVGGDYTVNTGTTPAGTSDIAGWSFLVGSNNVLVTNLSVNDGCWPSGSITVGLYVLGGAQVATATITKSSTLVGNYRFEPISPVILSKNTSYVILVSFTSSSWTIFLTSSGNSYASGITFSSARYVTGQVGLPSTDTTHNIAGSSFNGNFYVQTIATIFNVNILTGQTLVGVVTPNSSAIFQIDSTLKGALLPRMTTTQKNAVTATEGLIIYDNVLHDLQFYNGTAWITAGGVFSIAGTTNQINASASTGAVTLSLPNTLVVPGTIAVTGSGSGIVTIGSSTGTYNFNLPTSAGTSTYFLTSAGGGSSAMTWTNPATSLVTDIAGTANQINASASVGSVILSLSSTIVTPGSLRTTGFIGLGIAPATNIQFYINSSQTGSSGSLSGLQVSSPFGATSTNTLSEIDNIYISNDYSVNVGTISFAAGLNIGGGTTAGTITAGYGININAIAFGTTRYGLYVKDPSGGTAKAAIYTDSLSVGYVATTPPANGLIVTGKVGIGTSSIGSNPNVIINSSTSYALQMNGTQTADDGSENITLYISSSLSPTNTNKSSYSIFTQSNFIAGSAKTLISATSIYTSNQLGSNIGTISSSFGIYIDSGSAASGIVSAAYGLLINSQLCGTTNNNYGLYIIGKDTAGSTKGSRSLQLLTGTITGDDGSNSILINLGTILSPTNINISTFGILCQPSAQPNSSNAISAHYGIYANALGSLGSGSVVIAYSGYFVNPNVGTNKIALYADNMSIGYSSTTPPSSGLAISGDVCLGTSAVVANTTFTLATARANTGAVTYQQISVAGSFTASSTSSLANMRGISVTTSFIAASSQTVNTAAGVYVNLTASSNIGTLASVSAINVASGSASAGTVTRAVGITINSQNYGTTQTNLGLYLFGTDATSATNGTSALIKMDGFITGNESSVEYGIYNKLTLNPTTNTISISGIHNTPTAATQSSNTIPLFYALYSIGNIDTSSGGNVTTAYSGYFDVPGGGTNKVALYATDLSVGVAASGAATAGTIRTAPPSSHTAISFGTSLTLGTALQNTLGYDIMISICVSVTAAVSANFQIGVGSTNTPTKDNILPAVISAALTFTVTVIVPTNYYVLLDKTGTSSTSTNQLIVSAI